VINWYCQLIAPYLERYAPALAKIKLNFVKVRKGTDWGFPFTLHKTNNVNDGCIVIPANNIKRGRMAMSTQNDQLVKEFMTTLVHEIVHLHQKRNYTMYSKLYKRHFGMH